MSTKGRCVVDNCDNAAAYRESGLCHACYQGLYYWRGATPTKVVRRRRQLAKLEARMQLLQPSISVKRKKTGRAGG